MLYVVNVNDPKLKDLCRQIQVGLLPMLITLCLSSIGQHMSWVLTSLHLCTLCTDVLSAFALRENITKS